MKLILTLLAAITINVCHAQYLPSDSSFYKYSPPAKELEWRVRRLEICTQAFEKQARIGKHMMLGSAVCLSIGTTLVNKDYFDGLGWLCTVAGMVGMTTAKIMIFDAPRALRAEKVQKRRNP
jgi:hypothetical protein